MINRTLRKLLLLFVLLSATNASTAQQTLREQFLKPTAEARPWTFWYWMFGAVSTQGITADLEAMKHAGLGGAYLMPIKSTTQGTEYGGKIEQLSPEWWKMVHHSMAEADRLGLQLGMHICDGFALAGGPWISPKESMQKVVWTDTIVRGGKIKNLQLQHPEANEGYYEDIALLALPADGTVDEAPYRMTCVNTLPGEQMAEPDKAVNVDAKGVIRSSYPCYMEYEYAEPFTCRNVEVVLDGNNYQAHRLRVMASDDGVNYRFVKQLVPARQGWQNTDEQSTHSIPATTARYFRFYWTPEGSEPGSEDMDAAKWKPNLKIRQLRLHQEARLNQWEGKAGLVWRVAHRTPETEVGKADCVQPQQIINLTGSMKNGVLTARLPRGNWKLLRMGHTSTGHRNATGGGGRGLECNKFDRATVRKQFDNWFAQAFAQTDPALAHRVLKYMHVDSWECGSQNWSSNFAAEFERRRGYSLMPYLPLLAGVPMESAARSEDILRDVRTTISELTVDVFYTVLADAARQYDCETSAECVAPTMVGDGLLHYQKVNRPMGEFWLDSPTHDKLNDMLDAVSGAHIYGKNLIQAEGFTQLRGTWNEHPAMLKALLDRNYALGINKLFFHVYVHNPWMDRKPGMTLDGIGLFFQRDQTWWQKGAPALVSYATRCQALLQYGHPITDIAVFTGEEMPRRSILPHRLVPSLPGIFGEERVQSERTRLANVGQPLRVRPVGVTHSANMADPEKWVNPLRGYAYDSFNRDALLRLAQVKDGRITLPGGASYGVLVLPLPRPMSPDSLPLSSQVQARIEEFRKAGVVIPQLPYTADDFAAYGVARDVIVPEDIAWTHRRGKEADVYFIANQREERRTFTASLRVDGKRAERWNPMTGEVETNLAYVTANGRTEVTLTLEPNESTFIVFEKAACSLAAKCTACADKCSAAGKPQAVVAIGAASDQTQPLSVTSYTVSFVSTAKTVECSTLFDWSKEADDKVKYYSGTARYLTHFEYKSKSEGRIFLNLGKVADVATVTVNGVDCGTVWTAPYRVEITAALKSGMNRLEIEVTNTWANALSGAAKGKAPFEGIWTNGNYRMKEDVLLPAGLLGPLSLTSQFQPQTSKAQSITNKASLQ
ncbi:MAG: DNA-binding protein [Bacteroides sp.]|uniref:glycosyl hydrolase n=2 Tax=Bacteroides sp. TaxID=29523 RepID=UPI001B3D3F31|nr:glycosyl hydrolase [Bacteroides sp.]MBP6066803.1 DNA-binding protein [Bacteroides sp.]